MINLQSILTYAVLGLIAFIAVVVYRSICSRTIIRFVVDHSGLVEHRGISPRAEREIKTFFQQDVQVPQKVTISGQLDPQGRLRFHFRGAIDAGAKQQIRNFLHSIL